MKSKKSFGKNILLSLGGGHHKLYKEKLIREILFHPAS